MLNKNRFGCVCVLLVLIGFGICSANAGTVVAQWPQEWQADNQGEDGWFYQYYRESDGIYYLLDWNVAGYYGFSTELNIKSTESLSSADGSKQTALTWISDVSGELDISGTVSRLGGTISGADGCTAYIFHNDQQVFSAVFGNAAASETLDVTVSNVSVGDVFYFRVDQGANNWGDKVHWAPTINKLALAKWPQEYQTNNQGEDGWYYKYYSETNDAYYTLPWNSAGYYGWSDLKINSTESLSSTDGQKQTALTWVSEISDDLNISGTVSRLGDTISGADGCTAYIVVNGQQVYSVVFGNETDSQTFDIKVSDVEVGDSIYFCVDQGANNWGDRVHWAPTINPTETTKWPQDYQADNQGADGWYYKYYANSNGNYYNLPWNTNGYYGWSDLKINSTESLSSTDGQKQTALTWVSDFADAITITGSVSRLSDTISGADGCTAYIFVNDQEVFSKEFGNEIDSETFDLKIQNISVNDSVYFRVDQGANNWGDKVHWAPTINRVSNLTHGYKFFLEKGLMLAALTFPGSSNQNPLNSNNWSASNFTCVDTWEYESSPPANGASNGFWIERVEGDEDNLTQSTNEKKSAPTHNLFTIQFQDEQDIEDFTDLRFVQMATRINDLQTFYQNQLVYTNQGPGKSGYVDSTFSYSDLLDYTKKVKPDILNFTEYPYRWNNAGYSTRDFEGGSPTDMYIHMEMYRKAGLAGLTGDGSQPIPVGMYVEHYAQHNSAVNCHEPTESEVNLQTFAAWAFGFRKTTSFIYESTSGSDLDTILFDGAGDDGTPTDRFYEIAEMNRQSQNLSPALVRLISTGVSMNMGAHDKNGYEECNDLPEFMVNDPVNKVAVSEWIEGTSSWSYLIGFDVIDNPSEINDGYEGDIILGTFKLLDKSFAQSGHENDEYFMIVNGLTDADDDSDAEDCAQEITLKFDFGTSGITSLLELDRETGHVHRIPLTLNSGIYYLTVTLPGGTGNLYKFDTGDGFMDVDGLDTVCTDCPIVEVELDEDTGTAAADSMGNVLDGTVNGGATWVTGKFGSALDFDGVNDFVDFGKPLVLDLSGSRTISAWIKPEDYDEYNAIVSKYVWGYGLYTKNGKLCGYVEGATIDSGAASESSTPLSYGSLAPWQHVAMTFDINEGRIRLYINGQETSYTGWNTIVGSPRSTSAYKFYIGADSTQGNRYFFDGAIDDVKIFTRALSAQEIDDIYKE